MVKIVLILLCLVWFLNFWFLSHYFDTSTQEGFASFWKWRSVLYDSTFFLVCLALFVNFIGLNRAIACFMVIVTAGSVFDKAVFSIAGYVFGDIILIGLGLTVSAISYARDRRKFKESVH